MKTWCSFMSYLMYYWKCEHWVYKNKFETKLFHLFWTLLLNAFKEKDQNSKFQVYENYYTCPCIIWNSLDYDYRGIVAFKRLDIVTWVQRFFCLTGGLHEPKELYVAHKVRPVISFNYRNAQLFFANWMTDNIHV